MSEDQAARQKLLETIKKRRRSPMDSIDAQFEQCCREWATLENWSPMDAACLLSGLDPKRYHKFSKHIRVPAHVENLIKQIENDPRWKIMVTQISSTALMKSCDGLRIEGYIYQSLYTRL